MVNRRPRMTQEELDKEMDQYWGGNKGDANGTAAGPDTPSRDQPATNADDGDIDIDMAE